MSMSTTSGVHSDSSTPSNRSRHSYPKTLMEIQLQHHFHAKVYTTGDAVTGQVVIVPQRDVPFDLFDIVLLGTTQTRVESLGSPSESGHVFLKLSMPIPEEAYPVPRVLESGKPYTLPFHFVIPQHLTLGACSHAVEADSVYDAHIRLPPTMGTSGVGTGTGWDHNDLSPDMARVQYAIKARVYREAADPETTKPIKIVEATYPIRVLPATEEVPPLVLTKHDRIYKTTKSKTVRKGLLNSLPLLRSATGSKLGRLHARTCVPDVAPQPAAIMLQPDGRAAAPTTANVQLVFEPASADVPPPRVTAVSAKLTAHTYFSSGPITSFPNFGDWTRQDTMSQRRGVYSTSVPLFSRSISHFQWEAQVDAVRRDSGYCSESDNTSSDTAEPTSPLNRGGQRRRRTSTSPTAVRDDGSSSDSGLSYVAQLLVPVSLPLDKKMFIPTFHSCIASRTYSLQLTVSVAPGSTTSGYSQNHSHSSHSGRRKSRGESSSSSTSSSSAPAAATTSITLSIPLQIAVAEAASALQLQGQAPGLPSFEDALEEAEADAHLRPRLMSVPDIQYQETSSLPGYR